MSSKIRQTRDLAWCLLEPEESIDAEQYFNRSDNPKVLLCITKDPDTPKRTQKIEIYTDKNKKTQLDYLAKLSSSEDIKLTITTKEKKYDHKLTITSTSSTEAMQQFLNETFSTLLITGRPLRYYNCTFLLPLDLILDSEIAMTTHKAKISFNESIEIEQHKIIPPSSLLKFEKGKQTEDQIAHAQAYEYFYTHIQDQLFETDTNNKQAVTPAAHYRIKEGAIKNLTLHLKDKKRVTTANVEDVSMYEYYNGLLLLAIRVGLPENGYQDQNDPDYKLLCDEQRWWEPLVFGSDEVFETLEKLQVEYWLRYTKLVRILYANFFEQLTEEKIAPIELKDGNEMLISSDVKDPFSPLVLHFIKQFLTIENEQLIRDKRLKQLADERMFTVTSYVLAGTTPETSTPATAEFERLFSYALYVDQETDGYTKADNWAYDKNYIQGLMNEQTIRRWQSISNLSGYTDYSSIFMGFGNYFQLPTATVHIPYIYTKIQIQILFYRLTLEHFDRRISLATEKLMKSGVKAKEFSLLRRSLINFTNKYWFRELTPQIQGKEITTQMSKQQALDQKYNIIKDKLERANEYTTTLKDFWLQERAVFVGWIAVFLGVIAIFPALSESYLDSSKQITGISIIFAFTIATLSYFLWKSIKTSYHFIKRKVVNDECTRK